MLVLSVQETLSLEAPQLHCSRDGAEKPVGSAMLSPHRTSVMMRWPLRYRKNSGVQYS